MTKKKKTVPMKAQTVSITEVQDKWIEEENINASALIRQYLDFLMENKDKFKKLLDKFRRTHSDEWL